MVRDEDFVTVVLHELGHGLGFSAEVRIDTANNLVTKIQGINGTFMRNVEHHLVGQFPALTDIQRFTAVTSVNALHFTGASTVAARGSHAELFAPATVRAGSTLSHFDETTLPLELMSPFASGPQHNVGLAANVLEDIGWGPLVAPPPPAILPTIAGSLNGAVFTTGQTMSLTVSTTAGVPAAMADAYVGLQLPNGSLLVMQSNLLFSLALNPVVSNWAVPNLPPTPLFSFTFTGAEPKGVYKWLIVLATPGTFNFIGAITVIPFTVF